MRRGVVAALLALVVVSAWHDHGPASASAAPATINGWLRGWPMDGHDSQRSSLSPIVGPSRAHLVRKQAGFDARFVTADGAIIGIARSGQRFHTAVLRPSGPLRVLRGKVDGPSAIGPDGTILGVGADDSRASALSATGKLLWRVSSIGLPKSASPLVTANGSFFVAAEGHPEDGSSGLYVIDPSGKVTSHAVPGVPTFGVATGVDGGVYALLYDQESGTSSVAAFSPSLQERWRKPLSTSLETWGACMCLMVGPQGRLLLGDGTTLRAYEQTGAATWAVHKADGIGSIAERPDGSIVAAGTRLLTAISADGRTLWTADIHVHHQRPEGDATYRPSLAVDAAGKAYVGTGDGRVVEVSPAGRVVTRVPAGGYHYGFAPRVMLGPRHSLIVGGVDGVVRVYR